MKARKIMGIRTKLTLQIYTPQNSEFNSIFISLEVVSFLGSMEISLPLICSIDLLSLHYRSSSLVYINSGCSSIRANIIT